MIQVKETIISPVNLTMVRPQGIVMCMETTKESAQRIFSAAVQAANPMDSVRRHCRDILSLHRAGGFRRIISVGFGKAAVPMALALEEELGELLDDGVIITKYGHTSPRLPGRCRVFEAGHPTPDENGVLGTGEILRLVSDSDEYTLVIALISGGGSSLLVAPDAGITLAAKRETTEILLRAGAGIHELNTVRKHLSRVKGGRLARFIHPGRTVSLILSDVIGDNLDVIASGPTAPDTTSFSDAREVLRRFAPATGIPAEVEVHLAAGARGEIPETPGEGDPVFERVTNRIIGGNQAALLTARKTAEKLGLDTEILAAPLVGEAADAGRMLAGLALESSARQRERPLCILSGGETTVTVRGQGKGGRNQELALSFALEISGIPGITLLSAGTDGTDGPTDAAGAMVDGNTINAATKAEALRSLAENDSYTFFSRHGGLFVTGPTGTNVMDIQIIIIR